MKPLNAVFVLALMSTMLLSACDFFEQRNRRYDDGPQVAFAQTEQQIETVDEGEGTVAVEIQLIGPHRDSDLPVSVAVDDSSTAEEGRDYTLSSTSATISANSSTTEISIDVLDNSLNDGGTDYELYLSLSDAEGVEAAENLKTYSMIIRGEDEE